jgi:undecaprenyl-diphosphatase
MSILEAILLGIVQGLTEFLPISSSGHLILVPWLQDYRFLADNPDFNKTFDVALHAGTLVAAASYFWADVKRLTVAGLRSLRARAVRNADERLAWLLVIGTLPAVLVGGLGGEWIDDNLGEPWMICLLLIVFGALLMHADRRPQRRDLERGALRDGVIIGAAQAIALAPGTSRSGVTITAARYLGFDRDSAARLSFLLLIPAVLGATVYKAYEAIADGLPGGVAGPMVAGTIAAAVSGYLAIAWLLRLVRRHSYDGFAYYRFAAAGAGLLLIATGVRDATF